jgi:cysteine desulfuration protein SufE
VLDEDGGFEIRCNTEMVDLERFADEAERERVRALIAEHRELTGSPVAARVLDEWDDRYRYVIELGRTLPPLAESAHIDANKVRGCASQVWLVTHVKPDGSAGPILKFEGDSDAHIVRGLIAILFALYSGKSAREILAVDALALFDRLGLQENLTPQRSNGLRSMVERIRAEAKAALATAA